MPGRIFFLCAAISLCAAGTSFAQGVAKESRVVIGKIKIMIGTDSYEWTRDGVLSAADGEGDPADSAGSASRSGDRLKPDTIASFLGFAPGSEGSQEEISRWCRAAELRLLDSGYAYAASVSLVPARQNQAARTIVVSVSPGFLWRFSGGNAWAMIGREGLFGERFAARAYAGYNRNGLVVSHSRVAGLPLALGASGFWIGPGAGVGVSSVTGLPREGSTAEGTLAAGWFFHPDFLVGVDAAGSIPASIGSAGSLSVDHSSFSLQPYIRLRKYIVPQDSTLYGNESDVGADIRYFAFPLSGALKAEASGFLHARIFPGTTLAVGGSAGVSSGSASFDLHMTEDRSVRSGYSNDELRASSFAFGSAELRQRVFAANLPPGFDCVAQVFLFSDIAGISPVGASGVFAEGLSLVDAYGAGARVLFDSPVFAYFTFSYGWNHDGRGRFAFAATAGF